jgi:hypothetical protein
MLLTLSKCQERLNQEQENGAEEQLSFVFHLVKNTKFE